MVIWIISRFVDYLFPLLVPLLTWLWIALSRATPDASTLRICSNESLEEWITIVGCDERTWVDGRYVHAHLSFPNPCQDRPFQVASLSRIILDEYPKTSCPSVMVVTGTHLVRSAQEGTRTEHHPEVQNGRNKQPPQLPSPSASAGGWRLCAVGWKDAF